MSIATLALTTLLLSGQEKPDHTGRPKLLEIMKFLQSSDTCHIEGSRFVEYSPTHLEFEGDIQIFRHKKNLRYSYSGYWGDATLLIIGAQYMSISTGDEPFISEAPKSWAARPENPSLDGYGGIIVSLLAPPSEINSFVDETKPIVLEANPASPEISFFDRNGTKRLIRQNADKSIEIRTPSPGFPGFTDPNNSLEVFRVKSTNKSFPAWYFEIKK